MEEIAHKGRIKSVSPGSVTVEIVSSSACSACQAKGACPAGGTALKDIEVKTSSSAAYAVGQEVEVLLGSADAHKAVWTAYVIPLVLLVSFILLPLSLGLSEGLSALCGAGAAALYYMVLYLLRNRLGSKWTFRIRNINA